MEYHKTDGQNITFVYVNPSVYWHQKGSTLAYFVIVMVQRVLTSSHPGVSMLYGIYLKFS